MSPRVAKTLADDPAANLHLHRKREVDLETVVEIRDLRLSGF
jgi:hypothetical protein